MEATDSLLFDKRALTKLRRNLRRWHVRHGRDLPWRMAGDPYRVWISEIMLQQTTVTSVVPYYERFLTRFPNVHVLAKADEADVLRLWEGLGYYSRARNIHKTARIIAGDLGGQFPDDVDGLQRLPGIGRYTAGAIVSFAYDRRAAIVEANTLRLYCRLLGYDGDPRSVAGQQLLWSFAEQLLPRSSPGEFNQALIDLGATVCRPTEPDCPRCPLRTVCRTLAEGRVDEIPRPKPKTVITETTEASIAVKKGRAYLLRRRGEDERWAGMWDFLRFELPNVGATTGRSTAGRPTARLSPSLHRQLSERVSELTGIEVGPFEPTMILKHMVTRYRITLHCLSGDVVSGRLRTGSATLRWVKPTEFEQYPLSVTGRKFSERLRGDDD